MCCSNKSSGPYPLTQGHMTYLLLSISKWFYNSPLPPSTTSGLSTPLNRGSCVIVSRHQLAAPSEERRTIVQIVYRLKDCNFLSKGITKKSYFMYFPKFQKELCRRTNERKPLSWSPFLMKLQGQTLDFAVGFHQSGFSARSNGSSFLCKTATLLLKP